MKRQNGILLTQLVKCKAISSSIREGAAQSLAKAIQAGGSFLRLGEAAALGRPPWEPDPDPLIGMDPRGHCFGLKYSHPDLAWPPLESEALRKYGATGQFDFLQDSESIGLSQGWVSDTETSTLNKLAAGQLSLAAKWYPLVHPALGYIGEMGDNMPFGKAIHRLALKFIFWANFYGPAYVEKFGRDLFLNAPGWKKEELDDGGILYVVTENYLDWWQHPPKEVLAYFREHVPDVKLYRAKSRYE